jgi:hypothetical protein
MTECRVKETEMMTPTALLVLASIRPGPDYVGMCDASAAVALSAEMFVVANDEDNVLRLYKTEQGGPAAATVDLSAFLHVDPENPEADIEGATRVGDVIYWITSHGRNKNGKPRPSRKRFFATEVRSGPSGLEVKPVGQPCETLLAAMLAVPELKALLGDADQRAPEGEGGLNIEGLTHRPDGSLLIGFRNPLPTGKALLVPLENPADVVQGRAPRLGRAITLDLGAGEGGARKPAGIRSIEFVDSRAAYLIVAGPPGDGGPLHLYEWSGPESDRPALTATIESGTLNPEALVVYTPASGGTAVHLQLLSDDGERMIGGRACKDLGDPMKMRFRSSFVE